MALTQISTDGIKNGTITGSDLATDVDLVDNQKLRLGNSQDLQIYHNGTHSFIQDSGTGNLMLATSAFQVTNAAVSETMIYALPDGGVNLYYDNSKKFETTTSGVQITGHLFMDDSDIIKLGNSQDLEIYHDGSNSYIKNNNGDLILRDDAIELKAFSTTDTYLYAVNGGRVELRYDNSKKLETTSTGATVTGTLIADGLTVGDAERIKLGNDGDLELYHTGTETFIKNSTGTLNINNDGVTQIKNYADNEFIAKFTSGGSVELYHANSKKFHTTTSGAQITGHLFMDDNNIIKLGNSQDLQIYHDGSDSYIKDTGTGGLIINSNAFYVNNAGQTENMITAAENGAVNLYYDNNKKLETTSSGAKVIDQDTDTYFHVDTTNGNAGALYGSGSNIIALVTSANEYAVVGNANGSTDLYHNNSKVFETTSAGVTISGRVGIGTTSPNRTIHTHVNNSGANYHQFTNSACGTADTDGSFVGIDSGEDLIVWNQEVNAIRLATSNLERMRITSGGKVRIGDSLTSNAAGKFQVVEESGVDQANDANVYFETNAVDWNLKLYYNTTGAHYHIVFVEQGTQRGYIAGADGSNVTYTSGSDYRWKENIVDLSGSEGIEICKKLKPRKYNWIENREVTGEINTVDGFIAHEVEEAGVTGAVSGEKDAVYEDGSIKGQTLDYGQMTPVLAAAIKGLISKVEVLETEVAELKAA